MDNCLRDVYHLLKTIKQYLDRYINFGGCLKMREYRSHVMEE